MILLMTTAPPLNSPWIHGRPFPPLGLAYIAAALEKEGFQVECIDNYLLNKPIDHIKLEAKKSRPNIVGISCSSVTYQRCVETAKAVKEVLSSCKVVVGGPHPSFMPESMLQHPEIDYAVMGEGERAIVELATNITKNGDDSDIVTIPGVAYRCEGKIIKNAPIFISDLDKVPYPARHLLPMQLYSREIEFLSVKPVDYMNVIRGCPYDCAFCEIKKIWGYKCRAFSPPRVIAEIEHLITKFGTKGIYFAGDNFTIDEKRTLEICALIKQHKLDIKWVCDTRVDLISQNLLNKMKDAGCETIWFGVESGSPRILEKINRRIALRQIVDAFKLCKEEGIQTACSFMMGIPGETINDMNASFRFAKKLDPDWVRFNIYVAVPGSVLYEEILKKQLYDRMEDFVAYVKTEDFNYESLIDIQRRFLKGFNRSPKRILRKIRKEGFVSVLRRNLLSSRYM